MTNTRLALCDYSGLLVDLTQKFSGDEGEQYHQAVKLTLRGQNPYQEKPAGTLAPPVQELPIWKPFRIGVNKDMKSLLAALKKAGRDVSKYSLDIMGKAAFMLSQGEEDVDFCNASGAELGFTGNYTRPQLIERAETRFNLQRCQSQDGPHIAEQYKDQPNGEVLFMAMDPIADSVGDLDIFVVERSGDGGLWLDADYVSPVRLFFPDYRWVFRCHK